MEMKRIGGREETERRAEEGKRNGNEEKRRR